MMRVFAHLVPLAKGGVPVVVSESWRAPITLKPQFKTSNKETKQLASSWEGMVSVEIDAPFTSMQVTRRLVSECDELKHLASLTDDQLHDFVTLHRGREDSNLLWDRDTPIKLEKGRFVEPTLVDVGIYFPNLLELVFPSVIEERLLRVLPRDDSKPLLWLDVDGVVNGSKGSDEQQTISCFGDENGCWGVCYSPQIVRELNRLSTVCDVHWATAWGKRARFRLAPAIGLNDFNVWKGKGTLENFGNFDRPLIWIDDQLDDRAMDGSWMRKVQAPKVRAAFENHLLLAPCLVETTPKEILLWKEYGLTMRHIAQIDAFLATHGVVAEHVPEEAEPAKKTKKRKERRRKLGRQTDDDDNNDADGGDGAANVGDQP